MIYFTADTHFNHEKVIEYSRRPFKDLADMTEELITRWNTRVAVGDAVYHLGDFALTWGKKDAPLIDGLLSRLNGQKHLIKGNHDREAVYRSTHWVTVSEYKELKIDLGETHCKKIVLCHYAMRVWTGSHRGSFMLHGHSHGNLADIGGKILDVGVDLWDYCPISLDQVVEFMGNREIAIVDHHRADDNDNL